MQLYHMHAADSSCVLSMLEEAERGQQREVRTILRTLHDISDLMAELTPQHLPRSSEEFVGWSVCIGAPSR